MRPRPIDLPPDAPPLPGKSNPAPGIRDLVLGIKKQLQQFPPSCPSVVVGCSNVPVTVAIQEAPQIAIALPPPGNGILQVHAINISPPDGGLLTWRILNPQGVVAIAGPIHAATLTLTALQAGSEQLLVSYVYQGQTALAGARVRVVQVQIVQVPPIGVVCHTAPALPNLLPLTANGVPANGVYQWQIQNNAIVDFPGGLNPGDQAQINVQTVASGVTQVDVQYTLLNVGVTATVPVTVVQVTIVEAPDTAVAMHAVGAVANSATLNAQGTPGGGTYAWVVANTGVASFAGGLANAGNLATVNALTVAAGTTLVTVSYTAAGVTATATVNVHVVSVAIQEAPDYEVVCHAAGAPANTFQLNANPVPQVVGAGTLAWAIQNAGVEVDFPATGNPGNVTPVTLDTVAAGTTNVTVSYTLFNRVVQATVRVRVISVQIQPAPEVLMALPGAGIAAATQALLAVGTPGGAGTFAWQLLAHGGAAALTVQFQGGANPGNNANATLETIGAPGGTTDVEVTYTVGIAVARAQIECHIVAVTITQAAAAPPNPQLLKQYAGVPAWGVAAAGPAVTALNAVGVPAACTHGNAGVYAWQAINPLNARFPGGVLPGNNANTQAEAVATSPAIVGPVVAQFQVTYTLHGTPVVATVDVDCVPNCSQVSWLPAVNPPVAAAAAIGPQAQVACAHEAANQQPGAPGAGWLAGPGANWPVAGHAGTLLLAGTGQALATAAPNDPHHHGGACPLCSAAQLGIVYHSIDPNIAANQAVGDMLALRNQIRSCVQVWTQRYNAFVGTANAKRNAANLAVNAWANARNWAWLRSFGGSRINFSVLALVGGAARGRMFGVLRGVDSAGNPVRLRAISGVFTLLGANSARPNTYWSPGLNPTNTIHSATRGSRVYPVAPALNPVGGTFGSCAASKLLTHALHLGLSVSSMAEMWVGAPQGVRTDGQLQASCNNCRRYLGEMLCEAGGAARSDAYPAGGLPDPNGMPPNFGF
ncbi:MAG: hypothetical protein ABSC93_23935 [Bryobacteraceae bacterium]